MTTTLNGNLRIAIGIVGLLVIGAGIVAGYARLGAKADANSEDVGELKAEHDEDVEEIKAEHVKDVGELKAEDLIQWLDIDRNSDRAIRIEVQMKNIADDVGKILDKVERLHE